jgi:hypothetical protein
MNFKTYKSWFISQTHSFTNDIDLYSVLDKVNSLIPPQFILDIDGIYILKTKEMEQRNINAIYVDGIIYVSPDQDNEADLLDDIVHEVAHSVDKNYSTEIYNDGRFETEFMTKRGMLGDILSNLGHELPSNFTTEIEYDEEIDSFLFNKVGYNTVDKICNGIFINAYSATSIQEYWAVAFEKYFLLDFREVKRLSPIAYEKLELLIWR